MPKTYYDSELTGAQIESALEAINGVVTPSNNGKVLYIEDGQIKAASASRWSGGAVLEPLSVTANGDYTPPTGTDGFDSVHVAVPSATLTTKSITQNGTYNASSDNADGYSSVTVNVSGGSSAVVQPLSVTQNGTYNPPSGVDGYAPVTVNVSGGGDEEWLSLKNYIESSGTQWIDTGYIVKDDSKFDVVYSPNTTQPQYPTLFGVRDNDSGATAGRCTFFVKHNSFGSGSYAWGTGDESMGLPTRMYLSAKKQRCIFTKGTLKVQQTDGNALAFDFVSTYSASTTRSIYICTLNQGGADYGSVTHFNGKIYRFRIYEGNTLVHEFVPWQESGVACLKDTVSGNLLYNAGTGNFVYGTDT